MTDKPQLTKPAAFFLSLVLGFCVFCVGAAIAIIGGMWP
jgi:hypothetical protein